MWCGAKQLLPCVLLLLLLLLPPAGMVETFLDTHSQSPELVAAQVGLLDGTADAAQHACKS